MVKRILIALLLIALISLPLFFKNRNVQEVKKTPSDIGEIVATYKGVPAYENGKVIAKSHGRHYAWTGYYYGQKWQCVEYIKRFYYDALGHRMPNVWGHAKDFFDHDIPHGEMNEGRGLVQYFNGRDEKPKPDDLLVYAEGNYGHVSIVTEVRDDHIKVIQQNIYGSPTDTISLRFENGKWTIGKEGYPSGWLRKEEASQ